MPLPFDQLFAMEAFEGLRILRGHALTMPDVSIADVVEIIKNVEADAASLDLEAAIELHELIPSDPLVEGIDFYRRCIHILLIQGDHNWGRQITLGRGFFIRKLDRDKHNIFEQAGLLADPPDDGVESWWVETTVAIRADADAIRNDRARQAEKLTLECETQRLLAEGIEERPKWIGFEDSTAGYDVESYTVTQYGLNRLAIEVKSSISNPLEFQVTKNEWRVAQSMGEAYIFHIWDMRPEQPQLHIRTVAQVAVHIPVNQQDGAWTNVSIPLGGN